MFLVRFLLAALLLLPAAALAQTSPGFGDGAPVCANVPNPNCPGQTTSLNSAFAAKADFPGTGSAVPGIDQNILNTQTANYTIATTDCSKTIQAGTGATGFFTVTLPAVTGFASNCTVTVKNSDTGRGKALSGFPSDLQTILWPLQSATVKIINGAWQTTINPGRWKLISAPSFVIDSVNGADTNDGLAAGTGNALRTLGQFNAIVTDQLDTQLQIVSATFATATYTNLVASFQITGGGTVNLVGNGSTVNSSTNNVPAISLTCGPPTGQGFSGACGVIQGFTVTCSGGGNGVFVAVGFWLQFSSMSYGSCVGGSHIQVDSPTARFLLQANYTISGSAAFHLVAIGGGLIDWNSASFTVTLTGIPNFSSAFAFSEIGGQLVAFNVWSGAATGVRYVANTGGNIFTNGGGANYFPGNAPGTLATGGNYDTEWLAFTPTFACGTATITQSSARSRSFGKTTAIQIEFIITALGTCTNTVTFNLPNTANTVGTIPTIETAVNGALGMCRVSPGSTTANCFKGPALAAFLVNEHYVGSGVYENQ